MHSQVPVACIETSYPHADMSRCSGVDMSWCLRFNKHQNTGTGKSDQANINACIVDFLHEPYDSVRDPLDLLFNDLPMGD